MSNESSSDQTRAEEAAREPWIICADCGVYVREAKSFGGLCYWCTPEGKAEAERRIGARAEEEEEKE